MHARHASFNHDGYVSTSKSKIDSSIEVGLSRLTLLVPRFVRPDVIRSYKTPFFVYKFASCLPSRHSFALLSQTVPQAF